MESPEKYLTESFNEILFEGRNKEYGSYALRNFIPTHIRKGLIISTIASTVVILSMVINFDFFKKAQPEVVYTTTEIELYEPPQEFQTLPPAVPPLVEQVKSTELQEMEVKEDDEVKEETNVIAETESDTTTEGTSKTGSTHTSEHAGDGNTIYAKVDKNPEYPGGMKGLTRYLKDNIEYPKVARENNIEGTVDLLFVVNTDGTVSDVQVLKSLGGGCDKEAVRVVSEMRRWKPGMRGGVPVRVYQKLSVTFNLDGG